MVNANGCCWFAINASLSGWNFHFFNYLTYVLVIHFRLVQLPSSLCLFLRAAWGCCHRMPPSPASPAAGYMATWPLCGHASSFAPPCLEASTGTLTHGLPLCASRLWRGLLLTGAEVGPRLGIVASPGGFGFTFNFTTRGGVLYGSRSWGRHASCCLPYLAGVSLGLVHRRPLASAGGGRAAERLRRGVGFGFGV